LEGKEKESDVEHILMENTASWAGYFDITGPPALGLRRGEGKVMMQMDVPGPRS